MNLMYFKPFNVAQRQYVCISVCACLPVHVRVCRECVIYTHGSTLVFVPIRTSVYFLLSIVSLFELLYLSLYCIFKTNQREVMFNISTLFFSCYCSLHLTTSSGLPVKGALIWYWNEMDLFAWLHRVICCFVWKILNVAVYISHSIKDTL